MTSVLFKAVNSTVETVFQFTDEADLKRQLKVAVHEGSILVQDQKDILKYLKTGYNHIAINRSTVFEVAHNVDVEPKPDSSSARIPDVKQSRGRNGAKRRGS